MTVKDASRIVTAHRPNKTIIECLEFPTFYAFAMVDKGRENELFLGGYYTVDKADGTIDGFSPADDWGALSTAKPIDLAELL